MVTLTATGPEVHVATMTTALSDSYDSLMETLNHIKSLKLKYHLRYNVVYCYDEIVVDDDRLDSARSFKH